MPNGFKWLIHLKNMVGQTILDYRYRHKRTGIQNSPSASHPQAMVNWPPRTSGPPVCIDALQLQHTTPPHTGTTKSLHGCAGMACRLALLKVSYLYLWPSHLTSLLLSFTICLLTGSSMWTSFSVLQRGMGINRCLCEVVVGSGEGPNRCVVLFAFERFG